MGKIIHSAMRNRYISYNVRQFLADDYFISSALDPTADSDNFWKEAQKATGFPIDAFLEARIVLSELDINDGIADGASEAVWARISESNRKAAQKPAGNKAGGKRVLRYAVWFSAAACLAAIAVIGLRHGKSHSIADVQLSALSDKIELVMQGDRIELDSDNASISYDGTGTVSVDSKRYETKKTDETGTPLFNQISVPYGKRSLITLSDSSRIWVNSGTRMAYPSAFKPGRKREIFVDGEVFGEIFHDESRPFVIHTPNMRVEVLGTTLDVSDYSDRKERSVVLVDGSVRVKDGAVENLLTPNQMHYSDGGTLGAVTDTNVAYHISWRNGTLNFNKEPLGIIIGRVAKYYGVGIELPQEFADIAISGELCLCGEALPVIEALCETVGLRFVFENNSYKITL